MLKTSLLASVDTLSSDEHDTPSRKSSRRRRLSLERLDDTTFEVLHGDTYDGLYLGQRTPLGSSDAVPVSESVTPPRRGNRRNWHFGIRSMSPPMEVIHELYRSMQRLGIEWREKRGIWASSPERDVELGPVEWAGKDDLDIYTIDIRWRKRAVVVSISPQLRMTSHNLLMGQALMTLRLYKVESTTDSYLVCSHAGHPMILIATSASLTSRWISFIEGSTRRPRTPAPRIGLSQNTPKMNLLSQLL